MTDDAETRTERDFAVDGLVVWALVRARGDDVDVDGEVGASEKIGLGGVDCVEDADCGEEDESARGKGYGGQNILARLRVAMAW